MHRLSPVAASGGHSPLWCTSLSLRWPLPLRSPGSRRAGLSNCGARAELLRGTWGPPGPGPEPMSPALAGGLPTTEPPGKPGTIVFIHSPVNEHLGYFQFGALMNKVTKNVF